MRPDWDEYFLKVVSIVATRGTCDRGKSGCIITRDNRIIATGYVGSHPGFPHCDDAGHLLRKEFDEDGEIRQHCVRTIHAEQNAICQAARNGIELDSATVYCTMVPCRVCAMLIVSCGIKRVVAQRMYHAGGDSVEIFKKAGIDLTIIQHEVESYPDQ